VGDRADVECDRGGGWRLEFLSCLKFALRGRSLRDMYTGFALGLPLVGGRFRVLLGLGWRLE
jgi:hypothetical protein